VCRCISNQQECQTKGEASHRTADRPGRSFFTIAPAHERTEMSAVH